MIVTPPHPCDALPCLMIDCCLHLLDVVFCLSCLLAWWIVDAWLHVLCARNKGMEREHCLMMTETKNRFFNTVFLPIFFFLFLVAHDFLDTPTYLPGYPAFFVVWKCCNLIGQLGSQTLPSPPSSNQVRMWGVRRSTNRQYRSSPCVKLILSLCWALPGVDSATESGKKSRFFPNSVHQWVARSVQTATTWGSSFKRADKIHSNVIVYICGGISLKVGLKKSHVCFTDRFLITYWMALPFGLSLSVHTVYSASVCGTVDVGMATCAVSDSLRVVQFF